MIAAFKERACAEDQGHRSRYWALCRALGEWWTGPPTVELAGDVLRFAALVTGWAKWAGQYTWFLDHWDKLPKAKVDEYHGRLLSTGQDLQSRFDALLAWLECSAAELLALVEWASRSKGDT